MPAFTDSLFDGRLQLAKKLKSEDKRDDIFLGLKSFAFSSLTSVPFLLPAGGLVRGRRSGWRSITIIRFFSRFRFLPPNAEAMVPVVLQGYQRYIGGEPSGSPPMSYPLLLPATGYPSLYSR